MNTTLIKHEDKELKIEGFVNTQNSQSTKNSVTKKPLKYRKAERSDEISDPGRILQNNILTRQSNFTRGERNVPKYKLLSKQISNDHPEDDIK
jgi:hypothetical protein